MRRSWIGAALLVILLGASLLSDWNITRCHTPISRDLTNASRSALENDWSAASQLSHQAMDRWKRCQPFRAALGNQGAMEDVDSLLARLEICLDTQDPQTAALCAEIAQRITDLHPLGAWWDLL